MACLKSFSSLFNEFRLKNAVVVAEETISIDPVSTQKPEEPLFLSPQVWESQEIVKKKVNFQFLHYL